MMVKYPRLTFSNQVFVYVGYRPPVPVDVPVPACYIYLCAVNHLNRTPPNTVHGT